MNKYDTIPNPLNIIISIVHPVNWCVHIKKEQSWVLFVSADLDVILNTDIC